MSDDVEEPLQREALLIRLRLTGGNFGEPDERQRILALENQIEHTLIETGAGIFDGNELGAGFCTLYSYGSSADQLCEVLLPLVRAFRPPSGSYIVKRYNELDGRAREGKIAFEGT